MYAESEHHHLFIDVKASNMSRLWMNTGSFFYLSLEIQKQQKKNTVNIELAEQNQFK